MSLIAAEEKTNNIEVRSEQTINSKKKQKNKLFSKKHKR